MARVLIGNVRGSLANNLTTTTEGKGLDARQGKVLDDAKLNKSEVVSNLTTISTGKALDAHQGYYLNLKTLTQNTVSDRTGAAFSKNFLMVDTSSGNAEVNRTAYFKMSTTSGWFNIPIPPNGTQDVFSAGLVGIREVLWYDRSCIMVKITELSPRPARVWSVWYNGTRWSSWFCNSPK